jgi:GMP synthase (glutamine-hydrolysing)
MRKNEAAQVQAAFADFDLNLILVDAEERFLKKLAGVTDPEAKRKAIGEEFIRVFEEQSQQSGTLGDTLLAQGTIASDVIESAGVKSHHNVGGLPDNVDFRGIIEPLRDFYKHEVRELGLALGLPADLINRQPFPGPGLAVRCIGECTKERLDILREADAIFCREMTPCSQYFAVLLDMRAVGVKDGKRTYGCVCALRAVESTDFMSAGAVRLPWELLERVSARITAEVSEITRVVYDITPKPPGTIEWE